ncbi:ornithine cyclodeaminase family protein [Candidatus Bipolaricaulota bacterium]
MTNDLLYLSASDVTAVLPEPSELLDLLETMFRHKAEGDAELPPKMGVHPKSNSFIHAMPASVPPMSTAGIKWVSAYPGNAALSLPQVNGLIILNDLNTGLPVAVLDGSVITSARTAAASALAARYLARPESESLGILGCGIQGRSHVRAFATEFSLARVMAYDVSQDAIRRFATEMADQYGVEVCAAPSPQAAVESCDLVVTSGPITNPPHASIQPGWLQPGGFAVSIDYGSYWHPQALTEMDVLCTDDAAQFASHQAHGYLKGVPAIDLELADLVAGTKSGRSDMSERTFACNLGIALEDVVVAKAVVDRARLRRIGTSLPR